jgi:UDP-2,3-diacylglucosamine pyrophosphatase LpxH
MATGDKLVNLEVLKETVQKEVVDLKSAVVNDELLVTVPGGWEQNRVMSSGGVLTEVESNTFCHSAFLSVGRNATISISAGYKIFAWESAYNELGHAATDVTSGWTDGTVTYTYHSSTPYLIICVMKSDSSAITPVESVAAIAISYNTKTAFALKNDLRYAFGKNLVGTVPGKIYACYIPAGTKYTFSTSDGAAIGNGIAIHLHYLDGTTDYWTFAGNITSRTVDDVKDIIGLRLGALPRVPIQIEIGDTATTFEPHFDGVKNIDGDLDEALTFELGAIVGGNEVSSNTYARTGFVFLTAGSYITLGTSSKNVIYALYYYGEDQKYISSGDEITISAVDMPVKINNTGYYRLRVRYSDNSTISDISDFDVRVSIPGAINQEFVRNVSTKVYNPLLPATWSNRINEIQKAQGKTFAFAVQTDTHFATHTRTTNGVTFAANGDDYITLMKNLTKYVGFDFIANLGDIVRGYEFDTYAEMQTDLTEAVHRMVDGVCCPVMISMGNHDDACMNTETSESPSISAVMLPAEQYAKVLMPTKNTCFGNYKTNGKSLYYYVDYEDVRVINLNSRDLTYSTIGSSDVSVNHNAYSAEQIAWLSNTALDTDKQVLILTHVPLLESLSEDAADGSADVIDALKAFETNGGRVIGVMCGHKHSQASTTEDGILHVVFANGGDFAECVFVDTANHTITTKMVGNSTGKSDRTFSY